MNIQRVTIEYVRERLGTIRNPEETTLLAIEGSSASGKTTLAQLLANEFHANVFHMDDFFLQPFQRTPQRLAEPGGNVDRERFLEEVLHPLRQGHVVRYRPYDCHTCQLGALREVSPVGLHIIEGAYSTHPAFGDCYHMTVFLQISPQLQRERILRRNGAMAAHFFEEWIPMEQRYFDAFSIPEHCHLVLEVDERC